jgi:hypothetical protein
MNGVTYTFEDIFLLPDLQINDILHSENQPSRDFITDRYVVTVLLANNNLLNPKDYQCALNPSFKNLYLDKGVLLRYNNTKYVNRFDLLRSVLGCHMIPPITPVQIPITPLQIPITPVQIPITPVQIPITPVQIPITPVQIPITPVQIPITPVQIPITSVKARGRRKVNAQCDDNGVRQAINKYGEGILTKKFNDLSQEFGENAFNNNYFFLLVNALRIIGYQTDDRFISVLSYLSEDKYRLKKMIKAPAAKYIECLINIFRTYDEFKESFEEPIFDD